MSNAPHQDGLPALRKALEDAATSLETIGRIAGKASYLGDDGERIPTYMEHHDQVRGYAQSRASVARDALAELAARPLPVQAQCTDPMCACRGGPCAECTRGDAIAAGDEEPLNGQLDPRRAYDFGQLIARYSDSFNGQQWGGICESVDRKNLAVALDHITEAGAMLMNLASRLMGPQEVCENCAKAYPGCNSELQGEAACLFYPAAHPKAEPAPMTPEQVRDGIADWIDANIKHREFWTPEVVSLIKSIEIRPEVYARAHQAAPSAKEPTP